MNTTRYRDDRACPAARFTALLACAFTITLLPAGCNRPAAKAGGAGGPAAGVPVQVATARQADVPVEVAAIGRVEACQSVTVRPQVAGRVTAVHFVEGEAVAAEAPLFSLDARPYEAALRQAAAALARDRVLAQDAEVEARWQSGLLAQNAAAQREYDKAHALAASLAATVEADEAAVEQARLDLEYCTIRAPLAGRTGNRLADIGTVLKANEGALVTLNQVQPVYVVFAIAEQHLAEVRRRQAEGALPVVAVIPGDGEERERGRLSFIDNQVDMNTGTITLKGTFANAAETLWPGQYVGVRLTLRTEPDVVLVPSRAVQPGQQGSFVYVVKADQTVELRPMTVVRTVGDESVIGTGVVVGDVVVTEGHMRLAPGVRVATSVSPATQEAAP